MIAKCATCGKHFDVLWPHLWRYRREKSFLCSWSCLRAFDDKKGRNGDMKLNAEQKKTAIEMAISGKSPLKYIASLGINNPSCTWWNLKKNLQKNDPKTYAKLDIKPRKVETPEGTVADAMAGMKGATDTFFGKCKEMGLNVEAPTVKLDGALKVETPEGNMTVIATRVPPITQPVVYDGMVIREVEGNFGRYRRSDVGAAVYIDFENADGLDTLSLTVDQWRSFRSEHAKAAAILGVAL